MARANGVVAAAYAANGSVTSGSIAIQDMLFTAKLTEKTGSAESKFVADASGNTYGAFTNRNALDPAADANINVNGNITITDIKREASSVAMGASAASHVYGARAQSELYPLAQTASVTVTGSITVAAESIAKTNADKRADAFIEGYGISAKTNASIGGNVAVTIRSQAKSGGAMAWANGIAVGIESGKTIDVLSSVNSITATGSTYAFALSTLCNQGDPSRSGEAYGAHITNINAPLMLKAVSENAGLNDIKARPYGNGDISDSWETRPVKAAEYLGLGREDTLNFALGFDNVMDNGGNALRLLGAEFVNLKSGTLKLVAGSYIINQKTFSPGSTGNFGITTGVYGSTQTTEINIKDGATLWIDGEMYHSITEDDGVYSNGSATDNRFGTVNNNGKNAFTLDVDYTAKVNIKSGGTLKFSPKGSWKVSLLTQESGSNLIFGIEQNADLSYSISQLTTTGKATLAGRLRLELGTLGITGNPNPQTTVVIDAGELDIVGADLSGGKMLFYDYKFSKDNNQLNVEFTKNGASVIDVIDVGGAGSNAHNAMNALISTAANSNLPQLKAFMDMVGNLPEGGYAQAADLANQLHGEHVNSSHSANTQIQAAALNVVDSYLNGGSFGGSNAPITVGPNFATNSGGSLWRIKTAVTGTYDKQKADSRYFGYTAKSYTALIALEHCWAKTTAGVVLAYGHSQMDFKHFNGNKSDSDYFNISLYGRHDIGQAFVTGRLGYGRSEMESKRNLPSFGLTAKSKPKTNYFTTALFAGYDFNLEAWVITPSLGISWLSSNTGSVKESGAGNFNLRYNSHNSNSVELQALLSAKRTVGSLTPRATVGVAYEMADMQNKITTSFAQIPNMPGFESKSKSGQRFRFIGNLGLDMDVTQNINLSVDYLMTAHEDYQSHGGQVTLGISF